MIVALFGNKYTAEKSSKAARIIQLLQRFECTLLCCRHYYEFLTNEMGISFKAELFDTETPHADIAISLGGDGTFLQTAHRVGAMGIPILGINWGRLGFLADVASHQIEEVLTEVLKNYYQIEERTLLELSIASSGVAEKRFGLNEISIHKRDSSSMISIHTWVNDQFLTTYQADGLVISTPTGSTAYNLSVGGPIVIPGVETFILAPVSPHTLNMRPLIVADNVEITLKIDSRHRNFLVATDGRSITLDKSTEIRIRKAPHRIKLIKRIGYDFYDTLRQKLMWGTDIRH